MGEIALTKGLKRREDFKIEWRGEREGRGEVDEV
jgi:hypothetical protein